MELISSSKQLVLKPTNGKGMIGTAQHVFCYIEPAFKNYGCNETGQPTPEISAAVYESSEGGRLIELFGLFNKSLNELCLGQDQIIDFCQDYPEWLGTDFWTFFLFKVKGRFFVASTYLYSAGRPAVLVSEFSHGTAQGVDRIRRFVIPQ